MFTAFDTSTSAPGACAQLELELPAGEILDWKFEAITFKLAPDLRLTVDFFVVRPDHELEFREVKGFWEEDALVKVKTAAQLFPWFHFVGYTWDFVDKKPKDGPRRKKGMPRHWVRRDF
jgi:hypothetical protein